MEQPAFWNTTAAELLPRLQTTSQGLTDAEARQRLARSGANLLKRKVRTDVLTLLLAQFKSPILLILLCAATLSFFLGDHADTIIILTIVLASGLLGFWQERSAANAVEKLLAIVQIEARVVRDGKERDIPVEEVVPGDIVLLNTGYVNPGVSDLGVRRPGRIWGFEAETSIYFSESQAAHQPLLDPFHQH